MTDEQKRKPIAIAKSQVDFYETMLNNHIDEMYQEDIDRYLSLLVKSYEQVRTLEGERGEE